MARPRRTEGRPSAYERMEHAFWEMLSEMPYHEMTGKELRARAGVSHNTFYYHFENMDDMARQMFARFATPQVAATLFDFARAKTPFADAVLALPDFEERFAKMRVLARSGSPVIGGLLRDAILAAWLGAFGLDEGDLTEADRMDLAYAIGGFLAVLGSSQPCSPQVLLGFPQRELGRGVAARMAELAARGEQKRRG